MYVCVFLCVFVRQYREKERERDCERLLRHLTSLFVLILTPVVAYDISRPTIIRMYTFETEQGITNHGITQTGCAMNAAYCQGTCTYVIVHLGF